MSNQNFSEEFEYEISHHVEEYHLKEKYQKLANINFLSN